jgi:transcriptional regulator with XRE-family HTH domain
MSRTFSSARHKALVTFLKQKRKKSGLTQVQVAKRLHRYQSFVTAYESGQKRIDVVELTEIADGIGFHPSEAIRAILKVR